MASHITKMPASVNMLIQLSRHTDDPQLLMRDRLVELNLPLSAKRLQGPPHSYRSSAPKYVSDTSGRWHDDSKHHPVQAVVVCPSCCGVP